MSDLDDVTAKACSKKIEHLSEQVEKLKAELKSIDGALNDPRANLTLTTSEIIWELKDKLEKLTKERDALKTVPMKYRRMQFNAELQDKVTQLQKQLAALAEQNTKMREVIVLYSEATSEGYSGVFRACCASRPEEPHTRYCSCNKALSLPDLATSILNKEEGEIK